MNTPTLREAAQNARSLLDGMPAPNGYFLRIVQVIAQIDAALAQQPQPPESAPRKPLFAAAVAQRKWDELQAEGYRMQSIAFESPTRAGAIDAWGVVRWTAAPQVQPERIDLSAADVQGLTGGLPAAPQVQPAAPALKQVGYLTRRGALYGGNGGPSDTPVYCIVAAPPPAATRQPLTPGLSPQQEPKYTVNGSAIVNRASGLPIPPDEPVFIFRARDVHAREALEAYACVLTPGEHRDAVVQRVSDFAAFQRKHPERMKEPDTAAGGIGAEQEQP